MPFTAAARNAGGGSGRLAVTSATGPTCWWMKFSLSNRCANGSSRFHRINAPTSAELTQLAHTIAQRVGRCLNGKGGLRGMSRTATWLRRFIACEMPVDLGRE